MTKRFLTLWVVVLLVTVVLQQTAEARRLKVYSIPKTIAPGQFGLIVFENPNSDQVKAQSKCTAEKLIAWVKSDIPILRIEQNGKQVWMSLGSYQTMGDSVMATFMAPLSLEAGPASLFLVNDRDPSVPIPFTVVNSIDVKVKGIEGLGITPLGQFRVFGEGFVPTAIVDAKPAIDELEANIGYSKLSKAEQWTVLNHRIIKDWDKIPQGDFLFLEQGGKTWALFVEQCSLNSGGVALDFIAPPDIKSGPIKLTLKIRMNGNTVATSAPITVNVL